MLFYGLPGAGKTSLITTIASKFNLDISFLNITKELDDNSLTKAVTNLHDNSIMVLEDLDALFVDRDSKTNVSFSCILNILDGVLKKHKLITIITTNHKDRLDSALYRAGRIDFELEFKHATKTQIKNMFIHFCPNQDVNIFLDKIKSEKIKCTTADLNTFLFKYRKSNNIMEHFDTFIEIIKKKDDNNNSLANFYM